MRTGTAPDAPAPRGARQFGGSRRLGDARWLGGLRWLGDSRRLGGSRWLGGLRRLGGSRWLAAVRPLLRPLLRPRRRPGPTPTPACPSRAHQLRALVAVLDEAVAAQRPADEAVAACGEPGPPARGAARDCGLQSITLHRLRARLQDLWTTDPDLVAAQARAARLLAYDLWMLRASMNLACTTHPVDRTEAARLRLNGLGRPADDLRRLRDTLRAELSGA
ncbi:hypothetical protein M2163_003759 [Streptomyces sp. SAI-135]|uniref:hypothetical protein n=1 Tax=unclassified Streptomyces TaxID=2593676 RepID=UPI002474143C|nr:MULTISPECIES: hypothetical protein [unclassified Streptomyces]MDH6519256.1 hypothetical protein [Streptomyces sp. SAI-090]MDH6616651.1 hypothetical protein [Streptomyces sp. SAI-135]